jgi:hypothetical protein
MATGKGEEIGGVCALKVVLHIRPGRCVASEYSYAHL